MRYRRQLVFITYILIGIFLISSGLYKLIPQRVQAAEFSYKTQVDYTVDNAGGTHVAQKFNVTNNTSRIILQSIQLSTPTDEVNNLSVVYSDGAKIPATKAKKTTNVGGYVYNYVEINITFPRENGGEGLSWSFTINYDTSKLLETKGSARTVFIPALGKNSADGNYTVRLLVPDNFGKARSVGVAPKYGGVEDGKSVYIFSQSDLLEKSATLSFGDSTIYNLNFNFPLKNPSSKEQTFTVTLPPDTPSQKIFINKLDPKPQNTRLDDDGNVLADYKVSPNSTVTISTDIDGLVKYVDYDLSKSGSGKIRDIPNQLIKSYTGSTQYWQSNNQTIINKAKQATTNIESVAGKVRALNQFVIDTLSYNNEKIKYNIRQGALLAIENPDNAVCLEYSDLLIALLRSQGIPARNPVGYAYSGNLKATSDVSDSLHSWVQAYIPNIGWVDVDPTWGEKFNNFGKSDLDHFAFALWGKQDGTPSAVMSRGSDQNYQYENAKLVFKSVAPTAATAGSLSAKKYALFPLVGIIRYSVKAPDNVSGNNYQVEFSAEGEVIKEDLGSLAAGQSKDGLIKIIGKKYDASTIARFIRQEEGAPILATLVVTTDYWPMAASLILVSGIILFIMVRSFFKLYHLKIKEPIAPLVAQTPAQIRKKVKLAKKFQKQARSKVRKSSKR